MLVISLVLSIAVVHNGCINAKHHAPLDNAPILHADKGIALVPDGTILTLKSVQLVSVIHHIVPPTHPILYRICNMTFAPYGTMFTDFYRSMKNYSRFSYNRKKRFLSAMGLISGLLSTTLSVKNWIDLNHLESELKHVISQQRGIQSWTKNMTKIVNMNIDTINLLIHNWNEWKNLSSVLLHANKCKTDFIMTAISSIIDMTTSLKTLLKAITRLAQGKGGSADIQALNIYEPVSKLLAYRFSSDLVPRENAFYSMIEIIPGLVDEATNTFSFVAIVPLFSRQVIPAFFVLNTGYFDKNNHYRYCDLHGKVGFKAGILLQVHIDGCTQGDDTLYCSPHSTPIDPRTRMLARDSECPQASGIQFPVIQYRKVWIGCTTFDRSIMITVAKDGITQVKTLTSESGFFLLSRFNITKAWSGSIIIYQHFDISVSNALESLNYTHLEQEDLDHNILQDIKYLNHQNDLDHYYTNDLPLANRNYQWSVVILMVIAMIFLIWNITITSSLYKIRKGYSILVHDHNLLVKVVTQE